MTETVTINGKIFAVVKWTGSPWPKKIKRKAHRMIARPLDGEPVSHGTLTLTMAPLSVNGLFHNRKKGRGKTLAYRNWKAFADRELRDQPPWHVPGRIRVEVLVGGSKADSDNLLKATLDSLVTAGRIVDDSPKYVVKSSLEHDPAVRGTLIRIEACNPKFPAPSGIDGTQDDERAEAPRKLGEDGGRLRGCLPSPREGVQ